MTTYRLANSAAAGWAVVADAPRVRVVVGKGGITSADVTTIGLGADAATVRGQVLPGAPVARSGQ